MNSRLIIGFLVIFFLSGCSTQLTQQEQNLLEKDAKNKMLEIMYLDEIRIAEENDDKDAFQFYLNEYLKVERLKLPEHLKKHKDYIEGGINIKY